MADTIIWISGASRGIGQALVRTVPWEGARVIGISRGRAEGTEHLPADLSDPGAWGLVGDSFRRELHGFDGARAVFIHAAGVLEPVGFAGRVNSAAYTANVMLNSAAPQVLGHHFLAACAPLRCERRLVMLTSGAASSTYPGWTSYGAAKAAVDQWVRNAGAEQGEDGATVMAIAPGTVDTAMQAAIRAASEADFPMRQKFVELHAQGRLTDPVEAARGIWHLVKASPEHASAANGAVVDLRKL